MALTLAREGADGFSRHPGFERKLARALKGEAKFDAFTRGRYAADASIYQIMPLGVVFPKQADDLEAVLRIAGEDGLTIIPRGAGTSQNGQPIGAGLVVDFSRSFNAIKSYDPDARMVEVEPGIVLERL
ncbi:MAG TPA: FAD-binding protein, partial [Xanthobacteraceae bacterium]|nr:FAD-binding protein [Xanthobacteraceae bacterium]